jgi:hypothetical protein
MQVTLLPELNSIWVHLDIKVLIGVPWCAHVGRCEVHTGAAFGESRRIELTARDNFVPRYGQCNYTCTAGLLIILAG